MKMKLAPLLITIVALLSITYHSPAQNKIMVTAHRGDWRNAAENSLLAFVYAANRGADIVELNLKKTKDGESVSK